jgi:hypothetical protein
VGVTAGSREIRGRKPGTRDKNDNNNNFKKRRYPVTSPERG